MCFEKYGTSASKWAMGKASNFNIVRLAGTWIFFRCGHEKMLKTDVFHKTLIPRNLLKEKNIQDRTMWKLTSRAFRKCGTYEMLSIFHKEVIFINLQGPNLSKHILLLCDFSDGMNTFLEQLNFPLILWKGSNRRKFEPFHKIFWIENYLKH